MSTIDLVHEQVELILPSGLTGKAIAYTLSQWCKLVRYLDQAVKTNSVYFLV